MLIKARQIKSLSTSFVFHACCVPTFLVGSILQGDTERPKFLWSHSREKQQGFNHVKKQTKHTSIEVISLVRDLVSHVCQRVYIHKERKRQQHHLYIHTKTSDKIVGHIQNAKVRA
jgi:hypothetical protein